MKPHLLDVNVLVALLWTNHEHHAVASGWFRRHQRFGWVTTPLTQAGFVRVSSNPRVFRHAPSASKAAEILGRSLGHPSHRFWPDDVAFQDAIAPFGGRVVGHQQVTDGYLFGLAVRKGAVFATFDSSVASLAGSDAVLRAALLVLAPDSPVKAPGRSRA